SRSKPASAIETSATGFSNSLPAIPAVPSYSASAMWASSIARGRTNRGSFCPIDLPHDDQRADACSQEQYTADAMQNGESGHLVSHARVLHQGAQHELAHDGRCGAD